MINNRFLDIDSASWPDLETTATSSYVRRHVGSVGYFTLLYYYVKLRFCFEQILLQFLRMLAEETDSACPEVEEQELALSKTVDAMVSNIETSPEHSEQKKEKHRVYAHEWREKFSVNESMAETKKYLQKKEEKDCKSPRPEQVPSVSTNEVDEKTFKEEASKIANRRKFAVLYELLSACLADTPEDDKPKGYDARHRAALRLLTTWFDLKWIKMVRVSASCPFFYLSIIASLYMIFFTGSYRSGYFLFCNGCIEKGR